MVGFFSCSFYFFPPQQPVGITRNKRLSLTSLYDWKHFPRKSFFHAESETGSQDESISTAFFKEDPSDL